MKLIPFLSTAFALTAMFSVSHVFAISSDGQFVNTDVNVRLKAGSSNDKVEAAVRGNATSTVADDVRGKRDEVTDKDENVKEQLTAESHRSAVASFVRSLLDVANREGGIGSQVRLIAREQNDLASTSQEAITKIKDRGAFRTIFLGDDYKNINILRHEIATTTNNISKLNNLIDEIADDNNKAVLSAQVKVLKDSKVNLDTFVKIHGNSFSLFGWFIKMFSK